MAERNKRVDDEPSFFQGFKIAVSNIQYEGSLVWTRFGVLVGLNTITVGLLGFLIKDSSSITSRITILGGSLVGFVLSILWLHVTGRGFATIKLWTLTAREFEEKFPKEISLYRRGEKFKLNQPVEFDINGGIQLVRLLYVRNSISTEFVGILMILIFLAIYSLMIMFIMGNLYNETLFKSVGSKSTNINIQIK